jgi:isocitrate lyase
MSSTETEEELAAAWSSEERWKGIVRSFSPADVLRLCGTLRPDHTLARVGAERLWRLLREEPYIQTMAAVSGSQAIQHVLAGLKAINVSGGFVAADANDAREMYPDEGLYPVTSVPNIVRNINNSLRRADQITHAEGRTDVDWFVPIKADGEAGFGGNLNTFELTRQLIDAGASAISFEDQLPSAKKCGHLGGRVLVPTAEFLQKLNAARLAMDIAGTSTLLIARTEANTANLLSSDIDERDQPFLTGTRTPEGYFETAPGVDAAIARALAYAPYADLLWYETSQPSLEEATAFSRAVRERFPEKLFYYNCSSSFNWNRMLDEKAIATFQQDLGKLGYRFQNCSFMGFHAMQLSLFKIAKRYRETGMAAFADLQEEQREALKDGYRGWKHQNFVGTGYYDDVAETIAGRSPSTAALSGSTEEAQF